MNYIAVWAGLLLLVSGLALMNAPDAAAQQVLVLNASAVQPLKVVSSNPDFDGDGYPDDFHLRTELASGKGQRQCLNVALSRGAGRWTQRESICQAWTVETLDMPSRGQIPGRSSWVARLTPKLQIPDLAPLPSSRDAVLLRVDGKPAVLFYDGQRYMLHFRIDLQRVLFLEALDAFSRFEKAA